MKEYEICPHYNSTYDPSSQAVYNTSTHKIVAIDFEGSHSCVSDAIFAFIMIGSMTSALNLCSSNHYECY